MEKKKKKESKPPDFSLHVFNTRLFPDETLSKWEYSGRHLDLHKFETEKFLLE